jgi:hypothetical protein
MGCGGWAAKKSAKHCLVCDTYGCLGTTALPEQKFADFFQTRYSDISYIYICQISFTLLRVFHSGRGNNNRHLFNSSFTHIFHPVGFPLTDKSFLGNPTLKMMKKTRCNQFCRLFPPPPQFPMGILNGLLISTKPRIPFTDFQNFRSNQVENTKTNKFLKSFIK